MGSLHVSIPEPDPDAKIVEVIRRVPQDGGAEQVDQHQAEFHKIGEQNSTSSHNKIANRKRRTQYTDDERRYKYSMLVQRNGGGIMKRGVGRAVSDKMRVPVRVVQRIWMAGRRGGGIHAVASKKPKNCGRKWVEPDPDALRVLPLDGRMTIRASRGFGYEEEHPGPAAERR
ncbi:hypothetical protein ZWY2020_014758 [Hordeum vulgare]|nr:hypothetical protein ZWY2020_014758 [Hordeum vulgare]